MERVCHKTHKNVVCFFLIKNSIFRMWSVYLHFMTDLAFLQNKECFGYKWLKGSDRNQKYSTTRSNYCNSASDDNRLSGWYRFGGGAGTKMPTSCVPTYRCGRNAPGWMNGAHPTVAQGKVTRKVCYSWSSNCCQYSNNIEVVNCGLYYVYKLIPTRNCHFRYCGSDN